MADALARKLDALLQRAQQLSSFMPSQQQQVAKRQVLTVEDRAAACRFMAEMRRGMAEEMWARLNEGDYKRLLEVAPTYEKGVVNGGNPARSRRKT